MHVCTFVFHTNSECVTNSREILYEFASYTWSSQRHVSLCIYVAFIYKKIQINFLSMNYSGSDIHVQRHLLGDGIRIGNYYNRSLSLSDNDVPRHRCPMPQLTRKGRKMRTKVSL